MEPVPVLSIAGFDPAAGAGILADLRVFGALGLYGMAVVTAVTAQNTEDVTAVYPTEGDAIATQAETLITDIPPVATKTGMLASKEAVESVAAFAARDRLGRLVVDPVLASSSGAVLAEEGVLGAIRETLLGCCELVTPNLDEAGLLSGMEIVDRESAAAAAQVMRKLGAANVCITGGHWHEAPVDLLVTAEESIFLEGKRIGGERTYHGTGCFFSAAIAAYMALGESTGVAVRKAKKYTEAALRSSIRPGKGMAIPWLGSGLNHETPETNL